VSLNYDQELLTERDRIEETVQRALLTRRDPADSARKIVGSVYNGGAMPTTVPAWFLTHPADFGCNESEGAGCSATIDTTSTVPVLVLGPKVPSVGDLLPARMIGGKWIAERGGGGGCTTTICLRSGCDNATMISGATVAITGGGSATTGSNGCVTLSIPAAGTYTVTYTIPNETPVPGSHALTCGGTLTITTSFNPPGSTCCGGCPVPLVLTLTDPNTTIALTWGSTAGFPPFGFASCAAPPSRQAWGGSYQLTVAGVIDLSCHSGVCTSIKSSSQEITIYYVLCCTTATGSAPKFVIFRYWSYVLTGGSCYYFPTNLPTGCTFTACVANTVSGPSGTLTPSTCSPFFLTTNLSLNAAVISGCTVGPGSVDPAAGTLTVSA
jgi:hypothetical protein